jgi:hypothetical protein
MERALDRAPAALLMVPDRQRMLKDSFIFR